MAVRAVRRDLVRACGAVPGRPGAPHPLRPLRRSGEALSQARPPARFVCGRRGGAGAHGAAAPTPTGLAAAASEAARSLQPHQLRHARPSRRGPATEPDLAAPAPHHPGRQLDSRAPSRRQPASGGAADGGRPRVRGVRGEGSDGAGAHRRIRGRGRPRVRKLSSSVALFPRGRARQMDG